MSPDLFDEVAQRSLVCIATAHYDTLAALDGVPDEVKTITGWLADGSLGSRQFTPVHPELAQDPTKRQIRDALEDPSEPLVARDTAVAVFITGHGMFRDGTHWLCLKSTDVDKPSSTALRTSDVVGWFADTGVRHLLLVVDLCHAGGAAVDVARFDRDLPRSWLVLGSVTLNQQAKVEGLTGAIGAFLAEVNSPTGQKYDHGPYLQVGEFLEAVQGKLPEGQQLALLSPGLPDLGNASPCLPNPRYQPDAELPIAASRRAVALRPEDLAAHWGPASKGIPEDSGLPTTPPPRGAALRPEDLAAHWGPRSRGTAEHTEPGWLFTGRAALMTRLIDAATGDPGTLVVAGGAGTGKSAALARLVTLSDPGFAQAYAEQVAGIPRQLLPPQGCVDAALLAKGRLPDETLAELVDALGVPRPVGTGTPTRDQQVSALAQWLNRQPAPVTVVVDAVDESANPRDLLDGVLGQLAGGSGAPRLRLLLGVRSPGQDPDPAADPAADPAVGPGAVPSGLAELATGLPGATRLNVDDPPWWDPHDLADYAAAILTHAPTSPYPTAGPETTAAVADALAGSAGRSFLVTRLAAASLAARTEPVDPHATDWLNSVARGVVGVFGDDLHSALASHTDRLRALHLMRALAFSYGRGLPWNQIWPVVASAVADDPDLDDADQTPPRYGDADIVWLLGTRLGGYLVTDHEDDTTVYRLFHQSLTDILRADWDQMLTPTAP